MLVSDIFVFCSLGLPMARDDFPPLIHYQNEVLLVSFVLLLARCQTIHFREIESPEEHVTPLGTLLHKFLKLSFSVWNYSIELGRRKRYRKLHNGNDGPLALRNRHPQMSLICWHKRSGHRV